MKEIIKTSKMKISPPNNCTFQHLYTKKDSYIKLYEGPNTYIIRLILYLCTRLSRKKIFDKVQSFHSMICRINTIIGIDAFLVSLSSSYKNFYVVYIW